MTAVPPHVLYLHQAIKEHERVTKRKARPGDFETIADAVVSTMEKRGRFVEWVDFQKTWGAVSYLKTYVDKERLRRWRAEYFAGDEDEARLEALPFDVEKDFPEDWHVNLKIILNQVKPGNSEPCYVCRNPMTTRRVEGCCERHSVHMDCHAVMQVCRLQSHVFCTAGAFDPCVAFKSRACLTRARALEIRDTMRNLGECCRNPALWSVIHDEDVEFEPTVEFVPLASAANKLLDGETCSMCREPVEESQGALLTCMSHVTHVDCYAFWRVIRSKCGSACGDTECPGECFPAGSGCDHPLRLRQD